MHAIVVDRPGPPSALRWREVQDAVAGPGEVVIAVEAAGVNRADLGQRLGDYPPPAGASEYLGLECAGTIAELGPGVEDWAVGDRVAALLSGGGYAQRVAVPTGQLIPLPDSLSFVEGAALPETLCTVHANVGMLAHLAPGEALLVHGGASGIGTTAIQYAKALGADVLATVGSERKLDAIQPLGAGQLIDYTQVDFVTVVQDATGGRGADVILDIVGSPYLARNVDALAPDGRIVMIGGSWEPVEFDPLALMRKRGLIAATTLRARPSEQKAAIVASVREQAWPWVIEGRIRPVIDEVIPIAEASRAHERLERGDVVGKLVLEVV